MREILDRKVCKLIKIRMQILIKITSDSFRQGSSSYQTKESSTPMKEEKELSNSKPSEEFPKAVSTQKETESKRNRSILEIFEDL